MPRLVSVAVPVPHVDLLTYSVPDELETPSRGCRVLVPVGSRTLTGIVVGHPAPGGTPEDAVSTRDVLDALDDRPFLPDEIVSLCLWVADYYVCGPGDALAAALPPMSGMASTRMVRITEQGRATVAADAATGSLRRAILTVLAQGTPLTTDRVAILVERHTERARVAGVNAALNSLARDGLVEITQELRGHRAAFKTIRRAVLTVKGHELAQQLAETSADSSAAPHSHARAEAGSIAHKLSGHAREVLDILRDAPSGISTPELSRRGIRPDTLKRLASRGVLTMTRVRVERDPFARDGARLECDAPVVELTDEQQDAFDRLAPLLDAGTFRVAALHGVTGSGKTEVYLRLARRARDRGRTVLILVPEIALTPALVARVRTEFGDTVAVQHSGLSDGERHDQWQRIRSGTTAAVVGTRSAVFAPLDAPGLIVVDEEHDGSYKQDDTPRYNGRDVATMRGKHAGALVVLGSATPALETYHNALNGRYELVTLRRRVLERPLPAVHIVDMRQEFAERGPDVIMSDALRDSLAECLANREQAIVLLNRRGFATTVLCRQCGATLECPNCSVTLTVHRAARRVRCHYCNYSMAIPKACLLCAGPFLEHVGFGTERVEDALRQHFPDARIARLDRDTVNRRDGPVTVLSRVARREVDVLVGTQMVAKGHDFAGVTLVGVVSADVGLGVADFRAAERTFQILTQVAGRAGRGVVPGKAVIQTLHPAHYSIRHACNQDYPAFFDDEMAYRTAMRYPPTIALVNVVVRAKLFGAAMELGADLAVRIRRMSNAYRVLGPAPAPLGKLRGEHRVQLFMKGASRAAMRQALRAALAERPDLQRKVSVDVDPMGVL